MTSTPVKEVGSALMNPAVAQAGKTAVNAGGFQKVWNDQMSRGSAGSADRDNTAAATKQLQRGNSLKAKEAQTMPDDVDEPGEAVEELSVETQEKAMEVLNAAAFKLMQEIADTFGISMEELQAVMEEMDLEQIDLLDASKLGVLLLNLGGAEDVCALVTDGGLYENYRMLMEKLDAVLQDSAETLDTDPALLKELLEKAFGEEAALPAEEEQIPVRQEEVPRTAEPAEEETASVFDVVKEPVKQEQAAGNQSDGQMKGQERHAEGRTDKGQYVNPFIQDFRTAQFQPELRQTGSVSQSSPWSESTQAIMDQILDYMKIQLNADTTRLEMQLHPASLGTLQVQISAKAGMLTANFITQNETVKAALESQMVQLKEQFEEQGVRVEAIEVTVQTHEFERNLDEQGRGRNQQEPERKMRTRRIRLGDVPAMDSLEEEDALAAEMMAADGSTVDYTV